MSEPVHLRRELSRTIGTSLGLDIEMAVAEVGADLRGRALRARWPSISWAGRATGIRRRICRCNSRVWSTWATARSPGARAIARSGSVDWLDPMIGPAFAIRWRQATNFSCAAISVGSGSGASSPGRPSAATSSTSASTASRFPASSAIARSTPTIPRRGPSPLRFRHAPAWSGDRHQREVLSGRRAKVLRELPANDEPMRQQQFLRLFADPEGLQLVDDLGAEIRVGDANSM